MKYIDAERLKTHIQYLIKKDNYELFDVPELLSFIDSLQQEQPDIDKIKREWYNKGYLKGRKEANISARELGLPKLCDTQEQSEVDLEKEINNLDNIYFDLDGIAVVGATYYITVEDLKDIARHFYELGFNARNEK